LFLGAEVHRFLGDRRSRRRQPCPAGHMYCFRCRTPKPPFGGIVDLLPVSATIADLRGICECDAFMHRRVSHRTIAEAALNLSVTIPDAPPRLGGSASPSLNGDFVADWIRYAETQPGK